MVVKRQTAQAVIIGGGVMGLATAYYLAKNGMQDVVVVEKNTVCSGSSGRCAGGFRQQFPTVPEVQMAMDSVKLLETLEDELDYEFEFRQGGYLVLSYNEEHAAQAKKTMAMQQEVGLGVEWKNHSQIVDMAPWLNTDEGFTGAAWCPTDGVVNPFKMVFAYEHAFTRLGGKVYPHNEVKNITRIADDNFIVHTDKHEIFCSMLINCTGAFGKRIGAMLGVNIPVVPMAREKIITERVKFFQPFLCHSPLHTLHFNQTQCGSFLMSCANLHIKQRDDLKNTWRFTHETASAVGRLVPALKNIKIVRQWAGFYEATPDGQPYLGKIDGLKNYYQNLGYNGHGLMLAPSAGSALAAQILGNEVPVWYDTFAMNRLQA